MSVEDVLKTSAWDVPLRYIEDHKGTSIGHFLVTFSGRPRDVILPSEFMSLANPCTFLQAKKSPEKAF